MHDICVKQAAGGAQGRGEREVREEKRDVLRCDRKLNMILNAIKLA